MSGPSEMSGEVCEHCGVPLVSAEGHAFCAACILRSTSLAGLDRIGPYIIDSPLGEGGMGEVLLAFHEATGRAVALKVPTVGGGSQRASLLKRFAQEARLLSLLDHPGILPIYEVGEIQDRPWFAMKLAEGGTLADRLQETGAQPPRKAAEMLVTIASAVQYAHDHGILHRDLKPHNILLDETGQPMLGDFGLARPSRPSAELSHTLAVLGTPGYAAPEVAQGRTPSPAADIFSLGAILYHLLAGHAPFKGDSVTQVLDLVAQGKVVPLTHYGVPLDLWRICRKSLEPELEDRYASAAELEQDLRAWLDGRGVSVRPLSPLARLSRLIRRNPLVTALILTTAFAIIASLSSVLIAMKRVQQADTVQLQADQQVSAEHRHLERLGHVRLLLDSHRAGHRREALELLKAEWAFRPSETLRSLAIRALAHGDFVTEGSLDEKARTYAKPQRPTGAFSPASGRRATVGGSHDRELRIMDRSGGTEAVFQLEDSVTALQWNQAGNELAIGCLAKNTYLWKVGQANAVPHIHGRESATIAFAWHPDQRLIACQTQEGALHLWDLERREDLVMQRCGIPAVHPPRWDAAGTQILWSDVDNKPCRAAIILPVGVRMLRPVGADGHRETFCTLDLDAGSERVVWVTDEGAQLWDLKTGTHRLAIAKYGPEWMGARFLSDGLQSCGWSSGLRSLDAAALSAGQHLAAEGGVAPYVGAVLLDAAAEPPGWLALLERPANRFLLTHPNSTRPVKVLAQKDPFSIALTPDARLAATSSFQERSIQLWSLSSASPPRRLQVQEAGCNLAFAPNGRMLAVVGRHLVTLWNTSSGECVLTLTTTDPFHMATWSPDGGLLAVQTATRTRLHRVHDGAVIAELLNPSLEPGSRPVALAFDKQEPLLGEQREDGSVILWNLNAIQRELLLLGMDWPVNEGSQ